MGKQLLFSGSAVATVYLIDTGRDCLDSLPLGDFALCPTKPKNNPIGIQVHGEPSGPTFSHSEGAIIAIILLPQKLLISSGNRVNRIVQSVQPHYPPKARSAILRETTKWSGIGATTMHSKFPAVEIGYLFGCATTMLPKSFWSGLLCRTRLLKRSVRPQRSPKASGQKESHRDENSDNDSATTTLPKSFRSATARARSVTASGGATTTLPKSFRSDLYLLIYIVVHSVCDHNAPQKLPVRRVTDWIDQKRIHCATTTLPKSFRSGRWLKLFPRDIT